MSEASLLQLDSVLDKVVGVLPPNGMRIRMNGKIRPLLGFAIVTHRDPIANVTTALSYPIITEGILSWPGIEELLEAD